MDGSAVLDIKYRRGWSALYHCGGQYESVSTYQYKRVVLEWLVMLEGLVKFLLFCSWQV